ncbi:UDP-N-acetylglucosamine 2-epimerase (non-hydrolyzing) [Plectonema radiosum NIES-515]|uniref:UDP-N-acetylglucosamine 2-epimerase (Non-hydrolyzing) n=1 Tax=Plectonema radiosum NIES-515 TaxID=2986073 RepID=A0ABT3B184_9CYAN|nr:UDP-N-acetylglucosamine 2-epimerase (non-hydrolyzing) [Plectonema radiosum]MCV3214644.1 UDP-N-acetylglucosamine 2-epimerase (non-hydrolyzing) [Plectonema radiosum NIES-515]
MKIATILGARPQFIKASVVSSALKSAGIYEKIIHTGQHFDSLMSDIFFQDLGLPEPDYHLNIHSLNHGAMTGRMMEKLEEFLLQVKPDWICVYGDTNSTLAGALVAAKLCIPLAHIEAGLRSFNRQMPEEVNRVVTDHLSQLLFAPTPLAVECLQKEGIVEGVHLVGDVMMDSILTYQAKAKQTSEILVKYQLQPNKFYLATIHRPSNTDDSHRLSSILDNLTKLDFSVVFPIHPRTQAKIEKMGLSHYLNTNSILAIPPVSYLDMLMLESACKAVITDSGGIQKEAYILGRPCLTLRNETEWKETVEVGWNQLVQPETLCQAIANFTPPSEAPTLYGEGKASAKIAEIIGSCT